MTESADRPVLYSYFRSSSAWRVRIGLALKNVEYDYRAVHLLAGGGQQHSPEFTARNPMGQVPALEIDGLVLTQSLPILEYLEETRPEVALLPEEAGKRFRARQLAEIINSGIQPAQNLSVLQRIAEVFDDSKEVKLEWGAWVIARGFKALEAMLGECEGPYCMGNQVTLPDLFLVPQIYNARRFGLDMDEYPKLQAIESELAKLDAFRAAHAHRQPDTPDQLREK